MTPTTSRPSVPPIRHDEAMALAETAYLRFAEALALVGGHDWERPTPCSGWNVRDLAGHVLGAMRAAASVREFTGQFVEIKRRVRREGGTETDMMTEVQRARTATLTADELVAECRRLVGPATAGRRRIPSVARRIVRIPVEIGSIRETWTLGYLMDVILTRDTWLHRMDLCAALGSDPVLSPEHDGRIVADVAAEWARRHGTACRLVLGGPAGGSFVFGDPAADVEPIEFDAVEFCRTLSGRRPGSGLLATEVPF